MNTYLVIPREGEVTFLIRSLLSLTPYGTMNSSNAVVRTWNDLSSCHAKQASIGQSLLLPHPRWCNSRFMHANCKLVNASYSNGCNLIPPGVAHRDGNRTRTLSHRSASCYHSATEGRCRNQLSIHLELS